MATHVPDHVLSNDDLPAACPSWPAEKILEKTGIRERRVAAAGETALDLAKFLPPIPLSNRAYKNGKWLDPASELPDPFHH